MNLASSSGQKTASGQISTFSGALMGVDLTPPTTGYSILVIYDSEDSNTSGKTILTEVLVDAGAVGVNHEYFIPVAVNRGLYCTLTSVGSADSHYYVRFMLG
jgi:hypothetical protein